MPTPGDPQQSSATERRRLILMGRDTERFAEIATAAGFQMVTLPRDADFVAAYGGDGSLLGADREYPELPKIAIRRDGEFIKCPRHRNGQVLRRIVEGTHTVRHLPRIVASVNGREIQGINDITFHNALPASAVRYRVRIDGKPYSDEIVGDGLVMATPFGSAAYYRSITNSVFRVGLGLAFNNSTEGINHLVLNPISVVEVAVTRGPGIVFSDNLPQPIPVESGNTFTIRMGSTEAEIWELETLTCMDCKLAETGRPAGFRHV